MNVAQAKLPLPADGTDADQANDDSLKGDHRGEQAKDFDWENDESVCVEDQRRTVIFTNKRNQVCLMQEKAWDEELDPLMLFSMEAAVTVATNIVLEIVAYGHDPMVTPEQLRRIAARFTDAADKIEMTR
jgi:hypothetical protein